MKGIAIYMEGGGNSRDVRRDSHRHTPHGAGDGVYVEETTKRFVGENPYILDHCRRSCSVTCAPPSGFAKCRRARR